MEYIELNRSFVPIKKDEEIDLDIGRYWGKQVGGWLNWDGLLDKPRVVLLAEASSGKTAEFKAVTERLREKEKTAFFISIEELADEGFEQMLSSDDQSLFENWKSNCDEGYFFLDSLDEAKLNRKSFERALKKLAKDLGSSLQHCRFFISCRVTDWKESDDYELIKQHLPLPELNTSQTKIIDSESALLAPIFQDQEMNRLDEQDEKIKSEIIIVWLIPLDDEQQSALAQKQGVEDISQFSSAIRRQGLENLAERPGDLLELADYWKKNQCFSSLREMTEFAVKQKLSELDPYRPDNNDLKYLQAREGVERIAAGLTLGKTYTLQASSSDSSTGVLDSWTDAERNALLRRGIFAPATYGRIRFHHRSTQEYLTAQWFNRLLQEGCPRSEVFRLLFVESYGVKIVILHLKPIVAWLALNQDDIRDEVIERDPLVLIQYGDPDSLPINTRCRLLQSYAKMHKAGYFANDSLDRRALWMFAHPDLEGALREAWKYCDDDFRGVLIRLIREGAITACSDLVAQVAENSEANENHRIMAVQALNACNYSKSLSILAKKLVQNATSISENLVVGFVTELFPTYLNIDQLIAIIADTPPPVIGSTLGFSSVLEILWQKCPAEAKRRFMGGIADLALDYITLLQDYYISKGYGYLANHLESIAHDVITDLGQNEPENELIRLLMAIERTDLSDSALELKPSLDELIQRHLKVQRALFWADIEGKRNNNAFKDILIRRGYFNLYCGRTLWSLSDNDLFWLYSDLENRQPIVDKQIALSAIVSVLMDNKKLEKEKETLFHRVQKWPLLKEDLENYFKPHQENDEMRKSRLGREQREKKQRNKKSEKKESWQKFRDELIDDPAQISNPERRFQCIYRLAEWLKLETKQEHVKAARQWLLIKQAYNDEIAKVYRDAMKTHWRDTNPEENQVTTTWGAIYAYAGVGIEADENKGWATQLTVEEAKRATEHGCMSGQGYPDWMDALLAIYPTTVIPIIIKTFHSEWVSTVDGQSDFLCYYRDCDNPPPPEITNKLFDIMCKDKPGQPHSLKCGVVIFQRMTLSSDQQKRLKQRSIVLFEDFLSDKNVECAMQSLTLLFWVDSVCAFKKLDQWIEEEAKSDTQNERVTQIIGGMFYPDVSWPFTNSLKNFPIHILKDLVKLVYREIRPKDDVIHEGAFFADDRYCAESARNDILNALYNSIGSNAYKAMVKLADDSEIKKSNHRFRQMAREMAERDAEYPAWTEDDTLMFENKYSAPINNGDTLYQCVLNVLDDIRHGFTQNDASSKRLLSKLAEIGKGDEKSVQNWLAEQFALRANGRYHVHREAEVARKKMPDIIISGTTGLFEVAIEVKQADSWSPKELKKALEKQLAEDYLRPESRKHGVLFLTDHGMRNWRYPDSTKTIDFKELQNYLSGFFTDIINNDTKNTVKVSIFGISCLKRN